MANTYSWKINNLKYLQNYAHPSGTTLTNPVVHVQWTLTGTDSSGNTGIFSGATPFDPSQINPSSFMAYGSLTSATIATWLESVVIGSYQEHVLSQIQTQIDAKSNPVTSVDNSALPWVPSTGAGSGSPAGNDDSVNPPVTATLQSTPAPAPVQGVQGVQSTPAPAQGVQGVQGVQGT